MFEAKIPYRAMKSRRNCLRPVNRGPRPPSPKQERSERFELDRGISLWRLRLGYVRVRATTVKAREFATGKVLKSFELTTLYDNVVYGRSSDRYFVVEDPQIHDKQKK